MKTFSSEVLFGTVMLYFIVFSYCETVADYDTDSKPYRNNSVDEQKIFLFRLDAAAEEPNFQRVKRA